MKQQKKKLERCLNKKCEELETTRTDNKEIVKND